MNKAYPKLLWLHQFYITFIFKEMHLCTREKQWKQGKSEMEETEIYYLKCQMTPKAAK